jgi:hypothetical protein
MRMGGGWNWLKTVSKSGYGIGSVEPSCCSTRELVKRDKYLSVLSITYTEPVP